MTHPHTHSHLRDAAQQSTKRLSISLFLTLAFVIIEAAAGVFSNSLALLTDAAHNLTDVIALGFSWFAIRITTRPANERKTYGYHRVGILVALINSTTLVLIFALRGFQLFESGVKDDLSVKPYPSIPENHFIKMK